MKIALLGYGKEGQSTESYFKKHHEDLECDVFENFTPEEISQKDFSDYDYVFRSPSVPPLNLPNETSVTKYFFDHCPCPIIGVTATKGKGTTCSFIASLLKAHHDDVYLVISLRCVFVRGECTVEFDGTAFGTVALQNYLIGRYLRIVGEG